ncbi:calcium-responsive transactivator [Pontoporia blainvillei]|uniref:Calcium-responsive transactivator n=1 Tax=Pontoporia blainvillei TaxID=48723 RepID=A0ABX0S468_PONBL|nr:calcium-responsive transactivator [Pontoporia blainvillei]
MSVAFAFARQRGKGEVMQQTSQKMLAENHHLIPLILDYQSKGKTGSLIDATAACLPAAALPHAGADRHRSEPRVYGADGAERASQRLHKRVRRQPGLGARLHTATRDRPRRAYRLQGQGAISNDVSWANINVQPNPGGFVPLQQGAGRETALRTPVQGHDGRSGQGSSAVGQRPTGRYRSSRQGSSQSTCAGGRITVASCAATARPPRSP